MPIANGNNRSQILSPSVDTVPNSVISTIRIEPEDYKSVINDTSWNPINTLLEHLEGKSWLVDWYSQVLDRDSQLNGQQVTSSAVVNQYKKISQLELKVTQDLSQSQDQETKTMTYTGSSLVYSGVIPNEGDMFLANIGDGQVATFRVTSSIKKSVFKETAYEISYTIGTTDPTYIANLNSKVVASYVFRKDFLTHGQNPVIITSDSDTFEKLAGTYAKLCKQYFPRFFNRDFLTLMVPGQTQNLYDPFVVAFIKKMFTIDDHYLLQQIKVLNVDDDPVMSQTNIWDAIINVDKSYITTGFSQVGVVSTEQFAYDPFYASIRYTGVDNVIYPSNPVSGITTDLSTTNKTIDEIAIAPSNPVGSLSWAASTNLQGITGINGNSIYPVTQDNYYVFSNNFYSDTATQSGLEAAVTNFLLGGKPDIGSLSKSADLFNQWGLVEQFYYVPIVLVLIRAAFRTYQG